MANTDDPLAPDASKVSLDQRVIVPAFGLGRFAPFNWERLPHSTGIRLFWGRIAAWLLVLACVGWLMLAGAAWAFVKYRRGFTEVRFQHMLLLPWKLEDYRHEKGLFLIRQGLDLAEKQEWRPAFDLLRTGLSSAPEHMEARLMTARIYLMAGRPDMTRTLLLEGVAYHGDQLEYLRQMLGFFFGLQADDTVMAVTGDLRGRLDPASQAYRMATIAQSYAYFNRDRYDDASALLRDMRLLGAPEGRFVTARINWEQGWKNEALGQLRELTAQVPEDYEIYRTLIYYLREERRWGELRRAALARRFALPDKPEAYVDYIAVCGEQQDEAGRAEAETAFWGKFSGDAPALLKLSEDAARVGHVDMADRVLARCRELDKEQADAALLALLARTERRDYDGAISFAAHLGQESSKWPERQRLALGGLKAAALYGRGEELEAEPLVKRLCDSRLLPAQSLTALAAQIEKAGQGAQARRVLRHAVEIDPLNQPALAALLRSAAAAQELGDAVPLIERLLTMRKPPADLLRGLEAGLGSDRYLMLPGRVEVQAKIRARLERAEGRKSAD